MKHARQDYQDAIVDERLDVGGGIPDDEPVFLLRGQDVFAWRAVLAYADLLKSNPATVERRVADACRIQAMKMKAWAKAHGKAPDIPEDVGMTWDVEEEAEVTDQVDLGLDAGGLWQGTADGELPKGWASAEEIYTAVEGLRLASAPADVQAVFNTWLEAGDLSKGSFAAMVGSLSSGGGEG